MQEPLAIIGATLRAPGAPDIPTFWRRLMNGDRSMARIPTSRWDADEVIRRRPDIARAASLHWGSFIAGIEDFEPEFFGVTPREAVTMDPQQRLVMEAGFLCTEDAGIPLRALEGSRTGVYVAIGSYDYNRLFGRDLTSIDANAAIGTSLFAAPNRLSWFLRCKGPSMAIDAACASSLVALHQATQALRQGEIDLALVGAVNAILSPDVTISFAQTPLLSRDGHVRSLDANADGYVRGEACGMIAITRLPDARAAGHRVRALLRAVSLTQTGPRNGFAMPNGLAQTQVMQSCWESAGVGPQDVGYVEAHATGTALGDAVEIAAIESALAQGRRSGSALAVSGGFCRVGSYKPNIGYPECASGLVALIKVLGIFEHGVIPPQIDFADPNPAFAFAPHLRVSREPTAISAGEGRLIGVNAFGVGGTYGHALLEAPPRRIDRIRPAVRDLVLPVSARSNASLLDNARAFREMVANQTLDEAGEVCRSAARRRSHFPLRALLVAGTVAELSVQLGALTAPDAAPRRKPSRLHLRISGPASICEQLIADNAGTGTGDDEIIAGLVEIARRRLVASLTGDQKALLTVKLARRVLVTVLRLWGLPVVSVGGEPAWCGQKVSAKRRRARAIRSEDDDALADCAWVDEKDVPDTDVVVRLDLSPASESTGVSTRPSVIRRALLATAAEAYRLGVDLDWGQLWPDDSQSDVNLPAYVFQRRRYWIGADPRTAASTSASGSIEAAE